MEYSKLISVTGLGGLFELVASKADGAIVRSLEDKSTKFISSRQHSFSHLESIEVYTQRENVNLVEVLRAMEASSEPLPSEKDAAAIKKYFQKIYPDMDFDRVYASDMKKMVKWLALLKKNEIELKLREEEEEVKSDEDKAMEKEAADIEPATTEAVADEQTATAKKESKTTPKKKTAKKRGES
jgi:RecA-family ATPase